MTGHLSGVFMKTMLLGAVGAFAVAWASVPCAAEQYVDYTPQKGYWSINAVEVDPNHVDDYLTGLRASQVTAFEVLKRRGLIDDYKFMVRTGYVKGSPNVPDAGPGGPEGNLLGLQQGKGRCRRARL
jgi:hypothetical protein